MHAWLVTRPLARHGGGGIPIAACSELARQLPILHVCCSLLLCHMITSKADIHKLISQRDKILILASKWWLGAWSLPCFVATHTGVHIATCMYTVEDNVRGRIAI